MKKLLISMCLIVGACGSDDVLNPLAVDEATPVGVTQEVPSPVVVAQEEQATEESVVPEDFPDGYCESDYWILECGDSTALIATGPGCIKYIQLIFGDEAALICE
jgi:hypothetical protein